MSSYEIQIIYNNILNISSVSIEKYQGVYRLTFIISGQQPFVHTVLLGYDLMLIQFYHMIITTLIEIN